MARWNWTVALRQAAGPWTFCLAGDGGRGCGADGGPDELFAGGDRLAQSAAYVAAAERRITCEKLVPACKKCAPNHCVCDSIGAWMIAMRGCLRTLMR